SGCRVDACIEFLHKAHRVVAGDRFHATDAGRNAAFHDDLEEADIATATHVRTAAQLTREAEIEHAHFVAVLFAEQRHGAALHRFVERHHAHDARRVRQHFRVDDGFDLEA